MRRFIFFIFFFIIASCIIGCAYSKFSIAKTPDNSQKIRLNGYFYTGSPQAVNIVFFYSNGIVYTGSFQFTSIDSAVQYYLSDKNKTYSLKDKTSWGLYSISGKEIIIEKPEPTHGYPIHKLRGEILNDTTILINSFTEFGKTTVIPNGSYLYFRPLSLKPDSINNFIK